MKVFAAMIMMVLLAVPAALADNPITPDYVTLVSGSAESGGTALAFIQGQSDTDIRKYYYFDGKNNWPDYVGAECRVGEYIVPTRWSNRYFSNGQRVFDDDYLKSSVNDNVPMFNWFNAGWFQEGESALPYSGYGCKYPGEQLQAPEKANGRFVSSLSFPSKATAGESVTIQGKYYVTSPGPFVLEAFIDPQSQQPLAVVRSSESSCDGSYFWAGSRIEGVPGQVYDFQFTVKAPAQTGRYTVQVHAWTDCWKDGGEEINSVRSSIDVTRAECSALNVVSNIGNYYKELGRFVWTLGDSGAQNIIESAQCTVGQIDNYCGDRDSDGDSIPDGCDYCPQDKGVPQSNNGCHPCFGVDPYSASGKQCYETYADDYPPPERLYPIVNPVVDTQSVCEGNSVVTYAVRDWGDREVSKTTACSSGKECVVNDGRAACQSVQTSQPVTESGEANYACEGNTVVLRQPMSDGTVQTADVETCQDGCLEGECLYSTSGGVPTQRQSGDDYSGVVPDNANCVVDQDCGSNQVCQTYQCIDLDAGYCEVDSDCSATEECLGGLCAPAIETQCVDDAECGDAEYCFDGFCLQDFEYVDDDPSQPCTDDVLIDCQDGGSVTTEICVDEQLVPTGVTCENQNDPLNQGSGSGSRGSGFIPAVQEIPFILNEQGEVDGNKVFTYVAVIILLGGAGYFIYVKQFAKGKKGSKRRKRK